MKIRGDFVIQWRKQSKHNQNQNEDMAESGNQSIIIIVIVICNQNCLNNCYFGYTTEQQKKIPIFLLLYQYYVEYKRKNIKKEYLVPLSLVILLLINRAAIFQLSLSLSSVAYKYCHVE